MNNAEFPVKYFIKAVASTVFRRAIQRKPEWSNLVGFPRGWIDLASFSGPSEKCVDSVNSQPLVSDFVLSWVKFEREIRNV